MWALRGVSGTFRREQRGGGCQVHSTQDTRSKARPRGSVSVGTSWKAHPLSRRHFSILTAGVRVGLAWEQGGGAGTGRPGHLGWLHLQNVRRAIYSKLLSGGFLPLA